MPGALEIAEAFVAAINAHDVDALGRLMSEDHLFVDSLGNRLAGRAGMLIGWKSYFEMFPDYWIRVGGSACRDRTVMLWGAAGGTMHSGGIAVPGGAWQIPAAWRAETRGELLAEWQVYADNKPVYALMEGKAG